MVFPKRIAANPIPPRIAPPRLRGWAAGLLAAAAAAGAPAAEPGWDVQVLRANQVSAIVTVTPGGAVLREAGAAERLVEIWAEMRPGGGAATLPLWDLRLGYVMRERGRVQLRDAAEIHVGVLRDQCTFFATDLADGNPPVIPLAAGGEIRVGRGPGDSDPMLSVRARAARLCLAFVIPAAAEERLDLRVAGVLVPLPPLQSVEAMPRIPQYALDFVAPGGSAPPWRLAAIAAAGVALVLLAVVLLRRRLAARRVVAEAAGTPAAPPGKRAGAGPQASGVAGAGAGPAGGSRIPAPQPAHLRAVFAGLENPPAEGNAAFAEALQAYRLGDHPNAIARFERALADGLDPAYACPAHAILGEAYLQQNDLLRAAEHLLRSLAADPLTAAAAVPAALQLQAIYRANGMRRAAAAMARVVFAASGFEATLDPDTAARIRWLSLEFRRQRRRRRLRSLLGAIGLGGLLTPGRSGRR